MHFFDRTRQLDSWLREICFYYRDMPAQARLAIRNFLNLDMSNAKHIFIQDQLAWGLIETHAGARRVSTGNSGSSVLILQKNALQNLHSGLLNEIDSISQSGSIHSSNRGLTPNVSNRSLNALYRTTSPMETGKCIEQRDKLSDISAESIHDALMNRLTTIK